MDENRIEKMGDLKIADDVVVAIAGLAATEVKGVSSLGNGITHEMIVRSGEKSLSKAIHMEIPEDGIHLKLSLILDGTVSVPEVSAKVEERVTNTIESMTGMNTASLEITIAGVKI